MFAKSSFQQHLINPGNARAIYFNDAVSVGWIRGGPLLEIASVDPEQADAIRSLVAGSVENLSVENVTLVDADGRVNFKQRSSNAAEADAEQAMEAKLVAMPETAAISEMRFSLFSSA